MISNAPERKRWLSGEGSLHPAVTGRVGSSCFTMPASFAQRREFTLKLSLASCEASWPKFNIKFASARLRVSAPASLHCSSTSFPMLHIKMEG